MCVGISHPALTPFKASTPAGGGVTQLLEGPSTMHEALDLILASYELRKVNDTFL